MYTRYSFSFSLILCECDLSLRPFLGLAQNNNKIKITAKKEEKSDFAIKSRRNLVDKRAINIRWKNIIEIDSFLVDSNDIM